jgi:hypothetical protein
MLHYIGSHRTILLVALLLLCSGSQIWAASVTLAWDASTSSNISGYKVYVGTASRTYGTPVSIGNLTSYTVSSLTAGTYYFTVTAVNASGYESGYSNEVTTTVSGTSHTCDLNGDSSVNVLDVQRMINIILGTASSSSSYDLNGDGNVDVLDLQIITNVVLGLRSCPS